MSKPRSPIADLSDVELCGTLEAILYQTLLELYRRKKILKVELHNGALVFHLADATGGNGDGGMVMTVSYSDASPWRATGR
jgi:hypothetical protein